MNNPEKLTTRRKTKQKHNTICDGHDFTLANTNNVNVNKISVLLQNKIKIFSFDLCSI